MKRAILLSGFCFLILSTKAQQYHPLVDSGVIWNEEYGYCCLNNDNNYFYFGSKILLEGDTLIDGVHYHLLKYQSTYYLHYAPPNPYPEIYEGNNLNGPIMPIGALREDTSKRIWIRMFSGNSYPWYLQLPPDVDTILYDFSLELGDTFFQGLNTIAVVGNIDSVELLNGEFRKRYTFYENPSWESIYWIEGIGSDAGILGPYISIFEGGLALTCYHHNDQLLFEPEYFSYAQRLTCDSLDFPTGIERTNDSFYFLVSPNPVSAFLSINFSSPNFSSAEIRITDLLGRNLFADEIKSGETKKISTEKFLHSIVFCQLWQNGELIATKKVLIQ